MNNNTTNQPHDKNPEFIGTACRVAFRATDNGSEQWRQLYAPTAFATAWDGAPEGVVAVESRFEGVFSYVAVTPVARKATPVLDGKAFGGPYGYRVNLTFDPGTADEETVKAWVVLD
jgi:hypothetical protein